MSSPMQARNGWAFIPQLAFIIVKLLSQAVAPAFKGNASQQLSAAHLDLKEPKPGGSLLIAFLQLDIFHLSGPRP